MQRIGINVDEIQAGDEYHSPQGVHHWTAVEPAYSASGQTHVLVQYWPDGGIGPERVWDDRNGLPAPIVIHRP